MNQKKIKIIACILLLLLVALCLSGCTNTKENTSNYKIVTSFYPMYIMLLNITTGAQNIELTNMTEMNIGCIHDYTLRTEDLKKIQEADVFIMNGLGLENFLEKVVQTKEDLTIIDSSKKITDFVKEKEKVNEHTWTSTINYTKQVETIAEELGNLNPENKEIYLKNAEKYISSINGLKKEYSTKLESLKGKTAICLNESFSYLGKELGMNFITVETNHEESTLSGEVLSSLIKQIKEKNITYLIIDRNDDPKNAETIQRETGIAIYKLDSALSGSLSKDSYFHAMQGNFRILLGEEK